MTEKKAFDLAKAEKGEGKRWISQKGRGVSRDLKVLRPRRNKGRGSSYEENLSFFLSLSFPAFFESLSYWSFNKASVVR